MGTSTRFWLQNGEKTLPPSRALLWFCRQGRECLTHLQAKSDASLRRSIRPLANWPRRLFARRRERTQAEWRVWNPDRNIRGLVRDFLYKNRNVSYTNKD